VAAGDQDNFAPLAAIAWQVHVYGSPSEALREWCAAHGVVLRVFAWRAAHETAGLRRDALYLLRPDSYVALVDEAGAPDALERYFSARAIVPGGAPPI
jgi:hypothetical protein